jgi:uncharacterized protein (DUF2141 family)
MRLMRVLLLAMSQVGAAQAATVIVTVDGIDDRRGTINVGLCDKSLSREGCPYDAGQPATAGTVEIRFEGVRPGRYAVVGYQDLNGNNMFDRFLGLPREPYAVSNNAGDTLVPTFEKAALPIGEGLTRVRITLQRFMGR